MPRDPESEAAYAVEDSSHERVRGPLGKHLEWTSKRVPIPSPSPARLSARPFCKSPALFSIQAQTGEEGMAWVFSSLWLAFVLRKLCVEMVEPPRLLSHCMKASCPGRLPGPTAEFE